MTFESGRGRWWLIAAAAIAAVGGVFLAFKAAWDLWR
jgi:hypothetical protein